jgi:aspartate kinase
MTVCKFGGSSVADAAQIRKIAAILKSDSKRTIAVVSAPGRRTEDDIKITDLLYACEKEASEGGAYSRSFDLIRKRYLTIADELSVDSADIIQELTKIEKKITEGSGPDYAASRGEFLGAKLVAAFLGWEFFDPENHIILHTDGTVDEKTYDLLKQKLYLRKNYVIPGFYGSLVYGGVKTFLRGGADLTGAVVARSIRADMYENWTDAAGIYMADPRVVENPRVLKELTYQEIRELASVGFGVFHEEVIDPVRAAGIPIQVKNTNKPHDPGTMIVPGRDDSIQPVVGVSGKTGYCRLFVKKLMLKKDPDYKLKIRTILKVHGIDPEFSSIGFDSLAFYFNQESLKYHQELINRIQEELAPDEICTSEWLAMIGLVGEGLYDTPGILGKVSSALADAHINIRYLNYGGSLITCVIGVEDGDYQPALKVMYETLTL